MQFVCDQDFEKMTLTDKGRFCTFCKREVLDLRTKSPKEIQILKDTNGKLCGVFLPEQIEDIYPISIPLKKPFYFATFLTLFGININNVKGQNKNEVKTEQGITSANELKTEILSYYKDTTITVNENSPVKDEKDKKPFLTNKRYKYYWTKKIPFVTRQSNRRRTMGYF